MTSNPAPLTGPLVKIKLNASGNAGTYEYDTSAGVVTGNLKLVPTELSLWGEWKALFGEEILPNNRKTIPLAAAAMLIPFLVVLLGPILSWTEQVTFFANVGLAGVAAFAGVVAGLSPSTASPHWKFALTLFAATSAVLLVIAKVYGLPGS